MTRSEYLKIRQTRTHFALQAKRVLGRWVPQTGPIEDAEKILTKMRHDLINYRGGLDTSPSDVQNLITALRSTKNLPRTLEIYIQPNVSHHRRVMTARRIAYRLGLIDERPDWTEKRRRWEAMYGDDARQHIWVTKKDLRWSSGINLSAGSRVYYDGFGCFYTGNIKISAEEIEQIGVRRLT